MRAYFINAKKNIWYEEIEEPVPRVIQVSGTGPGYICRGNKAEDEAERLWATDFHLETLTDIAVYREKGDR